MAKTYYAWNNFEVVHPDEPGNARKNEKVNVGDEVSAETLGVTDDEFRAYIENGAVRPFEHPDMGNFSGSPVELAKAKAFAAQEGGYFDTQYGTIEIPAPEIDPETGRTVEAGENRIVIGGQEI